MTTHEIKGQEFEKITNEIRNTPGVYVIEEDHEYQYIKFMYHKMIYYIQASPYYPFTDVNHPGQWNFVPYRIIGVNTCQQMDFPLEYVGIRSLTNRSRPYTRPVNHEQKINVLLPVKELTIKNIVATKGGNREKSIISAGCIAIKGSTWNNAHKVVDVIALEPEPDGYFPGFQIDLVTRSICG